jgi:D-aspartate ligase
MAGAARTEAAAAPPAARVAARPGAGALVLGGDYRGLAVVRSLGRHGIPVTVLVDGDDSLGARSRYAGAHRRLHGHGDAETCAELLSISDELGLGGATLFPTSDRSAALVGRNHAALAERFVLTTPAWDVLRVAFDKRETYGLATALGIDHPRTWTAATAVEAAALELPYPVILKPAVREVDNALTVAKAWRVDDAATLEARFAEAAALLDPAELLIQELVPGGGEAQFSYTALCDDGRPLATLLARRTRQYPPDFGRASTYVESIDCPEIVEPAERLLAEVGFTGLVEVEFKRDPRDGRYLLLDVNPRVWGWHGLCQRAGVDFPYLAWRLARGEGVPATRAATGVRWVRLSTDLPTSLREIAGRRMSARAYLSSLRGPRAGAIFALDDPLPAVVELPMLVSTVVRRRLRGDVV